MLQSIVTINKLNITALSANGYFTQKSVKINNKYLIASIAAKGPSKKMLQLINMYENASITVKGPFKTDIRKRRKKANQFACGFRGKYLHDEV